MSKILSRLLGFLKYLLLIAAFGLIFIGIIFTYRRLDKSLTEAIPVFIPFVLLFITYIVNLFIKNKVIKDNLLYNFTAVLVFVVIIIIGLRAKFDTNMLLYFKYKIEYNPLYFSDNLASIQLMVYALTISNIMFLISTIFSDDRPGKVIQVEAPEIEEVEEEEDPTISNIEVVNAISKMPENQIVYQEKINPVNGITNNNSVEYKEEIDTL